MTRISRVISASLVYNTVKSHVNRWSLFALISFSLMIFKPEDSVVAEYHSLGCWSDTNDWRNPIMRAMEVLEGLHPSLNDDYKKREDPITKCAGAAKAYGYKVFAIQNGGQCFSGSDAEKSYTTYGPSTRCRFGVGGAVSNDVYKIS